MDVAQIVLSFRLSSTKCPPGLQGDKSVADCRATHQTHHPITVFLNDPTRKVEIVRAISNIGYEVVSEVTEAGGRLQPSGGQQGCDRTAGDRRTSESQSTRQRDKPPSFDELGWWNSSQGRLVIVLGALIVGALAYSRLLPFGSQFLFAVAGSIGTVPLVSRAWSAVREGTIITVEAIAVTAILGAMAVGALREAAVVTFLVALTILIGDRAAHRLGLRIREIGSLATLTASRETAHEFVHAPSRVNEDGVRIVTSPNRAVPIDGIGSATLSPIVELDSTGGGPNSRPIDPETFQDFQTGKPVDENLFARMVAVVKGANNVKGPIETFTGKLALSWMYLCSIVALGVALVPPLAFGESWSLSIYAALVLLLIGCPFAIKASASFPVASAIAGGVGRGLFVKDGAVLESIGKLRNIALEKTKTLTEGNPRVTDVVATSSLDGRELLRLAATAEQDSHHPIAAAIISHAKDRGIPLGGVSTFKEIPGGSILAVVDGHQIKIGAPARVGIHGSEIFSSFSRLERDGKTVSVVQVDRKTVGFIAVYDELRPGVEDGIIALKKLGLRPIIFTGESPGGVEVLGAQLGIVVKAGLSPEDKSSLLEAMAKGDGLITVSRGLDNSSEPSTAAVRVAMGIRIGASIPTADAAVVGDRVADVVPLVRLGRQAKAVIRQNITASIVLKAAVVVMIVAGITGLWVPALIEVGATVLVTANALRLLGSSV